MWLIRKPNWKDIYQRIYSDNHSFLIHLYRKGKNWGADVDVLEEAEPSDNLIILLAFDRIIDCIISDRIIIMCDSDMNTMILFEGNIEESTWTQVCLNLFIECKYQKSWGEYL